MEMLDAPNACLCLFPSSFVYVDALPTECLFFPESFPFLFWVLSFERASNFNSSDLSFFSS